MLAATQARIFDFQMHLMVTAENKEELELKKNTSSKFIRRYGTKNCCFNV